MHTNDLPENGHNEPEENIYEDKLNKLAHQTGACCRTGRSYELSCSILSLSFLEQEPDLYTIDHLKERY